MSAHCCEMMRLQLEKTCNEHGPECPDILIAKFKNGTFHIPIHDGGGSGIAIDYCPWCGADIRKKPEEREVFSRFWYVRTDTHLFDHEGACIYIEAVSDKGETERDVIRARRGELYTRRGVRTAKHTLRIRGYGKPRVIMVTVYRRRK